MEVVFFILINGFFFNSKISAFLPIPIAPYSSSTPNHLGPLITEVFNASNGLSPTATRDSSSL